MTEGGAPSTVSVEVLTAPSLEDGGLSLRPGGIRPNTMVLPCVAGELPMLTKNVCADWLAWKVTCPEAGEKSTSATPVPLMADQPTVITGPAPPARVMVIALDSPSVAVGLALEKLTVPPKSLSLRPKTCSKNGPSCAGSVGFISVIVKVSVPSAR